MFLKKYNARALLTINVVLIYIFSCGFKFVETKQTQEQLEEEASTFVNEFLNSTLKDFDNKKVISQMSKENNPTSATILSKRLFLYKDLGKLQSLSDAKGFV